MGGGVANDVLVRRQDLAIEMRFADVGVVVVVAVFLGDGMHAAHKGCARIDVRTSDVSMHFAFTAAGTSRLGRINAYSSALA